jgi:UDP-N-acetylglucosamine 2-epimerase (non-hydrolysing)
MLAIIEEILLQECPDVVLVERDMNTALAGVLTAVKLGIKVGHVEAELRSYDRRMPE